LKIIKRIIGTLRRRLTVNILQRRSFLFVVLFSVGFLSLAVSAHAQTTVVSGLTYPSVVIGTSKPIHVSFTVAYSGAISGDIFAAGVLDNATGNYVPGSVYTSNPNTCISASAVSPFAVCDYLLGSSSGSENLEFNLNLVQARTYQFSVFAGLGDSAGVMLPASYSSMGFKVTLRNYLVLTVSVPSNVSVTVDGSLWYPGYPNVELNPGNHTISVPEMVQINSTSRLKFSGWLDGSMLATRTVDLEDDATFGANYVTQFFVSSSGDSTLQSGWYDRGTVLQFSVDDRQVLNEYRMLLGGFDGWYNDGQLISKSSSASLTVNGPTMLAAGWNYLPYLPAIFGVALVGIILLVRSGRIVLTIRAPKRKTKAGYTKCVSCGAEIPTDWKRCFYCGTKQASLSKQGPGRR